MEKKYIGFLLALLVLVVGLAVFAGSAAWLVLFLVLLIAAGFLVFGPAVLILTAV